MFIFRRKQANYWLAAQLSGICLIILLLAGISPANGAEVAATVTVLPADEELVLSSIPLGSSSVHPGENSVVVLAFTVRNTYTESKSLTSFSVRDASSGLGNATQLLLNVDSLFVYKDSDNDSLLSVSDSLLASCAWNSATMTMSLGSLSISSATSTTFIVAANVADFPHDSDTIDVFIRPALDLTVADGTPIIAADSVNSLGFKVVDGLVAAQLRTISTGLTSIGTGDTVYNVFTVDIPRNGYATDTLRSFTVHNSGTADETDLEFMALFSDNGDGIWGGFTQEQLVAPLEYIGAHWAASNLAVPLTTPTTRFFIGSKTLPYPVNGATLTLNIPEYGILMASRNDGPLDLETEPVDTIEIQAEEGLLITPVALDDGVLIPGEIGPPAFAIGLRNSSRNATYLDSLALQIDLIDPRGASLADLESQFDSLLLYIDVDGDASSVDPTDILAATAPVVNGLCVVPTGGIEIEAGGGTVDLTVVLATDLVQARDGNTVQLGLNSQAEVFVSPAQPVFGNFPLESAPALEVDAFPAERVAVVSRPATNLYSGQLNIPILDFIVPANGYATDSLRSLTVTNVGSVDDEVAVGGVKLWRDVQADGFTVDDILIATLVRGTQSWTAANFSQFVPVAGQRLILTVDVSGDQFEGGTLAMTIPDGGMIYASGMVGPDDGVVFDPSTHLIIPPQRITVVSVPTISSTVRPGQTKRTVLTFALYNGYINESKTLSSIRLTNVSRTASDAEYADHEIGRVRLFYDADANRILDGDPAVGSGYFQNSLLTISGLSLSLPAESLAYFFVQSDVSLDAIDSDSLGVRINSIADFAFKETVSINGDIPLSSGGWRIIDGSVKSQFEVLPLTSQSVTPGDVMVPFMAFRPARNGDQEDTLLSVSVSNLGTADTSDIANIRLWMDSNGDEIWQVTDGLLANFNYTGTWWSAGGFTLPVTSTPPTLFITGDVSIEASDARMVNLSVPQVGCIYTSGNDGPLDSVLISGAQFTITGSNLRVARSANPRNYSVGETIPIEFSATNLSGSAMGSVVGTTELVAGASTVSLDSSHLGPVVLDPSNSTEFASYYTAIEPGAAYWSLRAIDLVAFDSSSELITEPVYIESAPTQVEVDFVSSMPATVTLGQRNIIGLSLTFVHGDTASSAAAAVLDSLVLRVYDGDGTALSADDVFARLRLITDEMRIVEPDVLPSSNSVTFVFEEPVIVEPAQERSLSAVVDVDSSTTATDFVLALSDASSAIFRDHNSGAGVPLNSSAGFPLATTTSRIERAPDQLLVSVREQQDLSVNLGQSDARALRVTLRHPGGVGTAPIQCTGLSLEMENDAYQRLDFSEVFEQIEVIHDGSVSALLTPGELDTTVVTLSFASPPILSPGETDSLDLLVDLRTNVQLQRVRMILVDSDGIMARNFSTGEAIPIAVDTTLSASQSDFPLYSSWIEMHYPAGGLQMCLSAEPDLSVLAGSDDVPLLNATLTYPVSEDNSPIRVKDFSLFVLDTLARALDPQTLFDRIGYSVDSLDPVYQTSVSSTSGKTLFDFGEDGILISPSDTVSLSLVADISADIIQDRFLLYFESLADIELVDATDSSNLPVASATTECASEIPYEAGPFSIIWPAGRPSLHSTSPVLVVAAAGQDNVPIFRGTLDYASDKPQGGLIFESFECTFYRKTNQGLTAIPGSSIFESLRIRVGDQVWAADTSLVTSTTLMWSDGNHEMEPGSTVEIQLEGDLNAVARPGNYIFEFIDSSFISFEDENAGSRLNPLLTTGSYPLASTEISVQAADLKGSFTNYPNPFIPGVGEGITRISYCLSEDASVDITLYTSTGELVSKIADNERREAGCHYDEDIWAGRNDRGLDVAPGTYICVITAEYDSGRQESARRKVTIIR